MQDKSKIERINSIIVYHSGAREQYSIPKLFLEQERLTVFITDYWISPNSILSLLFNRKVSRRYCDSLNHLCIKYNIFRVLYSFIIRKCFKKKLDGLLYISKLFCFFVNKTLSRRIQNKTLLWGFSWANLEVLQKFKDTPNVLTLHDQIDPGVTYYKIQQELFKKYPNLEKEEPYPSSKHIDRIVSEWELSDIILVNSNYSKKCLVSEGVNENKIITVPLICEKTIKEKTKKRGEFLNVGFVGNINLIKGFYLFFEVAKLLSDKMNFIAAGTNHFSQMFTQEAEKHIVFKGHLSKKEMDELYEELDILIFPTYCDGFGMVQLEAMSYGIPVIASVCCGDVVQDGINGFLVNHNFNEIVEKLLILDTNRGMLQSQSNSAIRRVLDFSRAEYSKALSNALEQKGVYL